MVQIIADVIITVVKLVLVCVLAACVDVLKYESNIIRWLRVFNYVYQLHDVWTSLKHHEHHHLSLHATEFHWLQNLEHNGLFSLEVDSKVNVSVGAVPYRVSDLLILWKVAIFDFIVLIVRVWLWLVIQNISVVLWKPLRIEFSVKIICNIVISVRVRLSKIA